ncbi:glycosyltransferase family 4 protein [Candidatus Bathyarchaeota archaeon]|nr:MAG: glycosyltransferase family 4 protein [Candidatus Bathyarchaeota archaeon]
MSTRRKRQARRIMHAPPPIGSTLGVAYVVPMGGGIHSFVFREVRELQKLGVQVHLFPTKVGEGPYQARPDWRVHAFDPLQALGCHFRLLWIHAHFGDHKFFVAHLCGHLTLRPVTVTIHAYELYNNPNPKFFKHALKDTSAVVTVARYNEGVLANEYEVPAGKIHVIPLFADVPDRQSPVKDKNGRVVVLCVARFVEKKGHTTLIRAIARLPRKYEAWIVGRGPLDVKSIAAAAGVADRVRVLGSLSDEDLQAVYEGATIFCLPSETTSEGDREGIPVALMEAMAHGLPVVASRNAGVPELVEEILVTEGDSAAVTDALREFGEDPSRRLSSGRRNAEIVSSRFSPRNVLLLKSLFETIARSPGRARTATNEVVLNA